MIGQNRAAFGGSRGYGVPAALLGQYAPYIVSQSAVAVSGTEDTNENTLATITIPGNALGLNGSIEVITNWTFTNSANAKTLRARFSGGSGTIYMSFGHTTSAGQAAMFVISNRNAANSQYGGAIAVNSTGGWGSTSNAGITSSVDTTAATTIVLTGQKALGTETLTLERYIAKINYGT